MPLCHYRENVVVDRESEIHAVIGRDVALVHGCACDGRPVVRVTGTREFDTMLSDPEHGFCYVKCRVGAAVIDRGRLVAA